MGTDEMNLRDKLRKIEALFAGAATPGERQAAGAAAERIRLLLAAAASAEAEIDCASASLTPGRAGCSSRSAAAMA